MAAARSLVEGPDSDCSCGPPAQCASSSSSDHEDMADHSNNAWSADTPHAAESQRPDPAQQGAHSASEVETIHSVSTIEDWPAMQSEGSDDEPPPLVHTDSDDDDEDMDPRPPAAGGPQIPGTSGQRHGFSQQPSQPQPSAPRPMFGFTGGPQMQHFLGPQGTSIGLTFGPIGSGPNIPSLEDMLNVVSMGMQVGQLRDDPFLQALQASLNMEMREKPKPARVAMNSVLMCKLCAGDAVECPISAETLEEGGWVARMPCGHYFAEEGLTRWLKQNNSCPVCRYEIMTEDHEYNIQKGLTLDNAEAAMLQTSRSPSDLIGQRMRRARAAITEQMLADALSETPPVSRSPAAKEACEGGGNALLRELHLERAVRARQKQEEAAEDVVMEEALIEALLARQRWICSACACAQPQRELDHGVLPAGCV